MWYLQQRFTWENSCFARSSPLVLGLRLCAKQVWRSDHVEAAVFTSEAISWKYVLKIDQREKNMKKCWNFAWLKESVLVLVSGKKNHRTLNACWRLHWEDQFTVKGRTVISVPIRSVTVFLARRAFQNCAVYYLLPPILVYSAVLQPGLMSVSYTLQPFWPP